MKIYSNFHDYYDIALSYGIDPKISYKRESRIVYDTEMIKDIHEKCRILTRSHFNFLVFCGKCYVIIPFKDELFYSSEKFEKFLEKIDKNGLFRFQNYYWCGFSKKSYVETLEKVKQINFVDMSVHFDCPVFYIRELDNIERSKRNHKNNFMIELNPNLKKLNFQSMKDPYTTFQDISMFIGNFLLTQPKTIEISDKDQIYKKGFDNNSFKNTKKVMK